MKFPISKKYFVSLFIVTGILIFAFSRLYFLTHPAYYSKDGVTTYSDVKQDYERYANMWYYGLTPYRQHYYEYPPATIPLLLTPLILDQHGIGKYYPNYRLQIFLIDLILSALVAFNIWKNRSPLGMKFFAWGFYIAGCVFLKNYIYEGIDLVFITALVASFTCRRFAQQDRYTLHWLSWMFFWLSVGIKFMNLPLLIPLWLISNQTLRAKIIACIGGFLIVWLIPLVMFRSSLSVSVVFHLNRSMEYASFPSFIVESINLFTKSETRLQEPPDFPFVGPVASQVLKIFGIIFPVSIVLFWWTSIWKLVQGQIKPWQKNFRNLIFKPYILSSQKDAFSYLVMMGIILVFILMLTGKVLSAPFHFWYLPLLAIFPFSNGKQMAWMYSWALFLLFISLTRVLVVDPELVLVAPLTVNFFLTCLRFLPKFVLIYLATRLSI